MGDESQKIDALFIDLDADAWRLLWHRRWLLSLVHRKCSMNFSMLRNHQDDRFSDFPRENIRSVPLTAATFIKFVEKSCQSFF